MIDATRRADTAKRCAAVTGRRRIVSRAPPWVPAGRGGLAPPLARAGRGEVPHDRLLALDSPAQAACARRIRHERSRLRSAASSAREVGVATRHHAERALTKPLDRSSRGSVPAKRRRRAPPSYRSSALTASASSVSTRVVRTRTRCLPRYLKRIRFPRTLTWRLRQGRDAVCASRPGIALGADPERARRSVAGARRPRCAPPLNRRTGRASVVPRASSRPRRATIQPPAVASGSTARESPVKSSCVDGVS